MIGICKLNFFQSTVEYLGALGWTCISNFGHGRSLQHQDIINKINGEVCSDKKEWKGHRKAGVLQSGKNINPAPFYSLIAFNCLNLFAKACKYIQVLRIYKKKIKKSLQ